MLRFQHSQCTPHHVCPVMFFSALSPHKLTRVDPVSSLTLMVNTANSGFSSCFVIIIFFRYVGRSLWIKRSHVSTMRFSRDGVSSSLSGMFSPWWVIPPSCFSKLSYTKATNLWYKSSGFLSSWRRMLSKS